MLNAGEMGEGAGMVYLDVRAVHLAPGLGRIIAFDLDFIGVADAYAGGHQPAERQNTGRNSFPHQAPPVRFRR